MKLINVYKPIESADRVINHACMMNAFLNIIEWSEMCLTSFPTLPLYWKDSFVVVCGKSIVTNAHICCSEGHHSIVYWVQLWSRGDYSWLSHCSKQWTILSSCMGLQSWRKISWFHRREEETAYRELAGSSSETNGFLFEHLVEMYLVSFVCG